jgi:hypothetical protein
MLVEKKMLSDVDLDSQVAFELPDREMLLVTIVITNLLNNNTVTVTLRNIDIAAQVCAAVLASPAPLDCTILQ